MEKFRSGYVSLTGRPNVGKSTLLNAILGEKVAIVSPKPQTTRNRIVGVKTLPDAQIIFIDTPGIHKPKHKLGELMVKEARESAKETDVILFMVEPGEPGSGDKFIIDILKDLNKPVFLLINKIDTVKKPEVLPLIDAYSRLYPFKEIIPLSALAGDGVDGLIKTVTDYLPEGPKYYPDDMLTDQLERFMAAEIIREKIIRHTEDEIPHSVAVEIKHWSERENGVVVIDANIYVEREGQKGIIIGKGGSKLKSIGTAARLDIEKLLDTRVFIELRVKIKKDWRGDERILKELGFN
ncbi:MAG TPA: GTPase Era [Nitrospiraceae bacterium]|nr:MAG: GTPase Era [Nitrospirae bacterium GWA2_46_11]OGW24107.1 MAG: GTPase Era [Nitrospirae bacterium GWB2_47_37]HAK88731.1 GTPase Era [Nitrospiraceae bacterium]HCZ11411.1 GTPase Era [Nitrospiraceae bacterium]